MECSIERPIEGSMGMVDCDICWRSGSYFGVLLRMAISAAQPQIREAASSFAAQLLMHSGSCGNHTGTDVEVSLWLEQLNIHLHTYVHACLLTCVHTCLFTCLYTCLCIGAGMAGAAWHMCVCLHISTHKSTHMSTYMCAHVYTHDIHVPAQMPIHISTHTSIHMSATHMSMPGVRVAGAARRRFIFCR